MKVSIAMKPSASPWADTDVRWIVPSPDAQIPSTYHFVVRPLPVACSSVLIQVPSGVAAFHAATSSSNANGELTGADIHAPLWYGMVSGPPAANGSVYVPAVSVPESVSTPPLAAVPLYEPDPTLSRAKLADGAPPWFFAAAGIEPTTIAATVNASVTIRVAERRAFMDILLIAQIELRLESDT